ncbi:hypothetical protein L1278_003421 [Pontibacter sp. HSC-36F09]|nr:hypothetical protein [Pontibacter sp. HSC-36F09]
MNRQKDVINQAELLISIKTAAIPNSQNRRIYELVYTKIPLRYMSGIFGSS